MTMSFLEFLWYILTNNKPWFIGAILLVSAILVFFIVSDHKKSKEQERIRKEQEQRIRDSGIFEVDKMNGQEFETFLQFLLQEMGYEASITKTSGDYGADLVLKMRSRSIIVQAKRYKNKVGLKAVQEIVSAKSYYDADECWVITNNYFTVPAITLANSNGVLLIDRDELVKWMLIKKRA